MTVLLSVIILIAKKAEGGNQVFCQAEVKIWSFFRICSCLESQRLERDGKTRSGDIHISHNFGHKEKQFSHLISKDKLISAFLSHLFSPENLLMSSFNKASQQFFLLEYESNPGIWRHEMEGLHLSGVPMDVKVLAMIDWPTSASILSMHSGHMTVWLKSRSPWTLELAFS